MKVSSLTPHPPNKELFRRSCMRFVTEGAGCYALANFEEDILYVGLASNLQRRFIQHLDVPEKVNATRQGRAMWFFWYESEDVNKIERTWMNMHVIEHGTLPLLNKVYSATST